MNKKILSFMFSTLLLLTACSNEETNDEDSTANSQEEGSTEIENESIESKEAEDVEVLNQSSYVTLDEETLGQNYIFVSDDRRSNVIFDNGIIRFSDGEGNLRYRLVNEGDRIVISGEVTEVYLFSESEDGYDLINIDDNGRVTNSIIKLIKN